ncbi:MAG: ABC transporter permease, partial [Phycisphaerales bacterium]|nr:ABC transporter permease [Phycisphaerales bacterium]
MTDLSIILRSLRLRLFSTVVTVLTVAIAVGLLLTLLILRSSGQSAFERGSGNAELLVSADNSPLVSVLNGIFYANAPRNPITMAKYDSIRTSFPWKWTVPMQLGDSYKGQPVVATNSDFFTEFQPIPGQPWAFGEGRRFAKPYELVVGSEAARITGLKMGDRVPLTHGFGGSREGGHVHAAHLFEVVGMLEPTGASHDRAIFTDLAGSWVLHAEDRLEREHHGDDHGHAHDDHGHAHDEHDHDHAHDDHDHDQDHAQDDHDHDH